jgi:flagella basal body P-ring formation protein FlgA
MPRTLLLAGMLLAAGSAPLAAQGRVPVAARDLPRGHVLTEADVRFADVPGGGGHGGPGWVTRRVVRVGEALRRPAVEPAQAVRSGDPVTVRWAGSGVAVALAGTAAKGGAPGERVWVNVGRGWRLEGTVAGPGEVTVETPGRAN